MSATVEINDAVFCQEHLEEVVGVFLNETEHHPNNSDSETLTNLIWCEVCDADLREDNDGFYGFDTVDRDPIQCPPASQTKEGVYACGKHGSPSTYHFRCHLLDVALLLYNPLPQWRHLELLRPRYIVLPFLLINLCETDGFVRYSL
ncbi:Fc.00g096120.m01.CDS01 [Cosmosporella sp. VM-42]